MPQVLKGSDAGKAYLKKLEEKIFQSVPANSRLPGLVIIQVGNDPASASYIKQKEKLATTHKIKFTHSHLKSDSSFQDIEKVILQHVKDPQVDGILLQLPLDAPALHKNNEAVEKLLSLIPPDKDVDGLCHFNQGRLFTRESTPDHWTSPLPCTALGVFRLLEYYGIQVKGKHAVVIGRSRLVGMPTAGLLTMAGATVTICHQHTENLCQFTRQSDILVAATGKKHLIRREHLKKGVVLVDVGISPNTDPEIASKITGDIHPECYELSSAYSPVPGGVGPMTVSSLIENTLRLYQKHVQ